MTGDGQVVPPDDRAAAGDRAAPFVDIRNVSKVYGSGQRAVVALQNVSASIRDGEFVSIVGPSGCGKSTLLKCVAGLEPCSKGAIHVAGRQVQSPPLDVGVVFQRDLLLDWRNALDNVLLAAEFRGFRGAAILERARALLDLVGLSGYEDRFPWELSGGMRQRVAIARALICQPKFLLMDEPFGALDALTRDEMNLELQAIWSQDRKTVLFITHGIDEAVFLSDRVLVMDRHPGRFIMDLPIDLPRPRTIALRDTPAFTHHTAAIRSAMVDAGIFRKA